MWNTLKPGSCITGSIGARPSSAGPSGRRSGPRRGPRTRRAPSSAVPRSSCSVRVGWEYSMVGVRAGQVVGDGAEQGRLALEVVGVVGGEHLDLVEARPPGPGRSWWCPPASSPPSPPSSLEQAATASAARAPPMRTVRPSRPTAVPLFICRQVGNTRTYAESHLERVDQLRPGQHPDQAVRRRVPQDRAASTSSTPARARASSTRRCPPPTATRCPPRPSSRATSWRPAPTSPSATTSWPPSIPRRAARSTSRSSSTSSTSTRCSTTPPTTSPPTRRPPSPTPCSPRRWRRRARSASPGS